MGEVMKMKLIVERIILGEIEGRKDVGLWFGE